MMAWKCLVYILNGRYSGMCGGTSYGQASNPSVGRFQINDDDDDDDDWLLKNMGMANTENGLTLKLC